jgi:hypothetical protein
MRGFYFCEKCNLFIQVLSTIRTRNIRQEKIIIPYCCHCKGKVKEVEPIKYNKKDYNLCIRIYRTYKLRGKNRLIDLRLKFLR